MFRYRLLSILAALMPAGVAIAQMGPPTVTVAPVEQRDMSLDESLVGTVEAVTRSVLAAEEPGLVAERKFEEGQVVEAGHVLVMLNTDLIEQQIESSRALVDAAEARIVADKARAEQTARERDRLQELKDNGAIPERDLANATTDDQVAVADVNAAVANLAVRKSELSQLELLLSKMTIKTPISGVIAKRMVEVGQWIQQGDPVAEIVQLTPLYVRFPVPERLITRVKPGQAVQITMDALPGRTIRGEVDHILPEADAASRTFAVRLKVDNADGEIRPGLFARVNVSMSSVGGFVVPRDAVVPSEKGLHVVAIREGKTVIVPVVRTGGDATGVYVEGELLPNDKVVVRGNESLRPDQPVVVTSADTPADGSPTP